MDASNFRWCMKFRFMIYKGICETGWCKSKKCQFYRREKPGEAQRLEISKR